MAHLMQPVGAEGLGRALMPLMLTTVMPNTDGMSDETQQAFFGAKVQEYARLLAHYPPDIIRDACDAHVKRSKFFPAIAELCEFAEPALALRHRQAKRLAVLVKNGGKPPVVVEEFKGEPREATLRTLIKHARRRGQTANAIRYERELAELEGRPMEGWAIATDVSEAVPAGPSLHGEYLACTSDGRAITGTLPRDGRKWERASDAASKPWQAGAPVYQQQPEEPPLPDEIPEGDAP